MQRCRISCWISYLAAVLILSTYSITAQSAECKKKPTTCMRTYVKAEDYKSASLLYNQNVELFQSPREKKRRKKELPKLARYYQDILAPQVQESRVKLSSIQFDALDPTGWEAAHSSLESIDAVIDEYESHEILQDPEYKLDAAIELSTDYRAVKDKITSQRRSAFLAYDHSTSKRFFDLYPSRVSAFPASRKLFVKEIWTDLLPIVNTMTTGDLLQLVDAWTGGNPRLLRSIYGAEVKSDIADSYYRKVIELVADQDDVNLAEFFDAVAAASAISLKPSDAVSSRLLLITAESAGEFGIKFNLDVSMPFKVVSDIEMGSNFESYDVVILLGATHIALEEKTVGTRIIRSKYQDGTETTNNPAYISAQSTYNMAINNYSIAESNFSRATTALNSCQATSNYCFVQSYQYGAASRLVGDAGDALTKAQRRLQNVKPYVTKPVYRDYEVPVSSIELEKIVSGNVAFIVPSTHYVRSKEFRLSEKKIIEVAVNVHPKDAGAARRFDSARDLESKESGDFEITVFDILSNLSANNSIIGRVDDVRSFLASASRSEPKMVSAVQTNTQTLSSSTARASHPALDGVVVVRTPLGNLGTGFYVASHMLLTNYHVVGNSSYVEIEFYDGRSSTGQIVSQDIDRDLALIRTNVAGRPLNLYGKSVLPLGADVIAIGHPKGLKFSLTKGIISAVREQKSTTSIGLGGRFLYVQTDTAISPGNSGGPLLLGNEVVGINSEKLVDVEVEGIGFALHYTEIARFLAMNLSN